MTGQPTPRVGPLAIAVTGALRAGTRSVLEAAFLGWLADEGRERGGGHEDPRETMMDLAPLVDCARQLDLDPAEVFGPLVADAPEWLRHVIEAFLRRTDVTPGAFGWSLVQLEDGPAYRFGWPRAARTAFPDAEPARGA